MTEFKRKKNEAYLLCEHVFSPCCSWRRESKKTSLPIEIQPTRGCVPAYLGKKVKLS